MAEIWTFISPSWHPALNDITLKASTKQFSFKCFSANTALNASALVLLLHSFYIADIHHIKPCTNSNYTTPRLSLHLAMRRGQLLWWPHTRASIVYISHTRSAAQHQTQTPIINPEIHAPTCVFFSRIPVSSSAYSWPRISIAKHWCEANRPFLLGRIIRATLQYIRMIWAVRQYIALRLKLALSSGTRRASRHSAIDTRSTLLSGKLSTTDPITTNPQSKRVFFRSSNGSEDDTGEILHGCKKSHYN